MATQTQVQKQKIGTLYLVSTFSIKMLEFGMPRNPSSQ